MKKNAKPQNQRIQMMPTGVMEYKGQPYEIMISKKTGEIAFFQDCELIMDANLQKELLFELLERNKES